MKRAVRQLGRMYYFFNGIEMQIMKDTETDEDTERYDIGNYFNVVNSRNERQMHLYLLEIFKETK